MAHLVDLGGGRAEERGILVLVRSNLRCSTSASRRRYALGTTGTHSALEGGSRTDACTHAHNELHTRAHNIAGSCGASRCTWSELIAQHRIGVVEDRD
eukprot:2123473-Rhodomonas_salina.3